MEPSADTLNIPPHMAPTIDFYLPAHSRDEAIVWARETLADMVHHADADLIRACKVLIANSPDDYAFASELIAVLRVPQ